MPIGMKEPQVRAEVVMLPLTKLMLIEFKRMANQNQDGEIEISAKRPFVSLSPPPL